MTTLGHLDASSEILKINFKTSSSVSIGLAVAGTQTFIIGNKSDKRNNFSHLLNPTGGIVNGSLFMNFRLKKKEKYIERVVDRLPLMTYGLKLSLEAWILKFKKKIIQ